MNTNGLPTDAAISAEIRQSKNRVSIVGWLFGGYGYLQTDRYGNIVAGHWPPARARGLQVLMR